MKLESIEAMVKEELEICKRSREDDMFLYYRIAVKVAENDVAHLAFCIVMRNYKELGLPTYESVRRSRQKVQAKFPYLKDPKTAVRRAESEEDFLRYARS